MQRDEWSTGLRRAGRRAVAVVLAAGVLTVADPVRAAPAAEDPEPTGFFETYRGHHIMGWGRDESACAYIDGVQLVLYPTGDGWYGSALQAFEQERGLRAVTRASVRTLGDFALAPPADPVAHCPTFTVGPAPK